MKQHILKPLAVGPCAKQTVTAHVVTPEGEIFTATNYVLRPQETCPRAGMATGQGYDLCDNVCRQPAHAEINAVLHAGHKARGAVMYVEGHTYVCDACRKFADGHGIVEIKMGTPK